MVRFLDDNLSFTSRLIGILLYWYSKFDVRFIPYNFIKRSNHIMNRNNYFTPTNYASIEIFVFISYFLDRFISYNFLIKIIPPVWLLK